MSCIKPPWYRSLARYLHPSANKDLAVMWHMGSHRTGWHMSLPLSSAAGKVKWPLYSALWRFRLALALCFSNSSLLERLWLVERSPGPSRCFRSRASHAVPAAHPAMLAAGADGGGWAKRCCPRRWRDSWLGSACGEKPRNSGSAHPTPDAVVVAAELE